MPIYTYRCQACGVQFDRRQSFSARSLERCPECKGRVNRLIQPAGIIFKGSGWYSTDHRSSHKSSASRATPGKNASPSGKDNADN